jgi:hypothetical protein
VRKGIQACPRHTHSARPTPIYPKSRQRSLDYSQTPHKLRGNRLLTSATTIPQPQRRRKRLRGSQIKPRLSVEAQLTALSTSTQTNGPTRHPRPHPRKSERLVKDLAKFGYFPTRRTNSFWCHITRPLQFCSVVRLRRQNRWLPTRRALDECPYLPVSDYI